MEYRRGLAMRILSVRLSVRRDVRCTLFAVIFWPKLKHAAARIACDSGPTSIKVALEVYLYTTMRYIN